MLQRRLYLISFIVRANGVQFLRPMMLNGREFTKVRNLLADLFEEGLIVNYGVTDEPPLTADQALRFIKEEVGDPRPAPTP